jgi:hypothetical protein
LRHATQRSCGRQRDPGGKRAAHDRPRVAPRAANRVQSLCAE